MRGKSSGGGHAFVLDGYMFRRRNAINSSQTDSQYLLHMNWGWREGHYDGYYNAGVFNPALRAVITDDGVNDGGNAVVDITAYEKWLRTITWSDPAWY